MAHVPAPHDSQEGRKGPPLLVPGAQHAIHHPDGPIRRAQQQRSGIEVIAPPSNAATTSRPSTGANPNKSGRHSVSIEALRESTKIVTFPSTAFSQVQVNQVFNPEGPALSSGPLDTVQSGDAVPNGTVAGAVQAVVNDPVDPNSPLGQRALGRVARTAGGR
jgi:hypothetical protein